MSTFVLIPGAGGVAWYWHRVVPLLTAAGHEAIPVDLPGSRRQRRTDRVRGHRHGRDRGPD